MFNSWVIIDEATDIRFRACVVAEVKFQHGDADHVETCEIPVKHDDVVAFGNFLEECRGTMSESEGGRATPNSQVTTSSVRISLVTSAIPPAGRSC